VSEENRLEIFRLQIFIIGNYARRGRERTRTRTRRRRRRNMIEPK
jgi:hypothetical protein